VWILCRHPGGLIQHDDVAQRTSTDTRRRRMMDWTIRISPTHQQQQQQQGVGMTADTITEPQ